MIKINQEHPPGTRRDRATKRIVLMALTLIAVGAFSSVMATSSLATNTTTCKFFEQGKAFCNKPLTAGVTIESANGIVCTAGPLTLPKAAASRAETYLLTAGHCIEDGGGENRAWFAFNQAGERKEIGKSGPFINALAADVGVIKITNPGEWTAAGNPSLYAVMVKWGTLGKEITSVPITGEMAPALTHKDCHEGQTTGENCGKIVNLTQSITVEGITTENLVESEGANSLGGDSGGPWYSTEGSGLLLEGTQVGKKGATNNPVFEPLTTSFRVLNETKGLNLELLTTANEVRNKQTKSGPLVLEGGGATLECSSTAGQWKISPAGNEVTKEAKLGYDIEKWNGCSAKSSLIKGVTANVKECALQFEEASSTAKMTIVSECTIEVKVLGTCLISIPGAQKGLEKNLLENSGENLLIKSEDGGITSKPNSACLGIKETKEAQLKATLTVAGVKVV